MKSYIVTYTVLHTIENREVRVKSVRAESKVEALMWVVNTTGVSGVMSVERVKE